MKYFILVTMSLLVAMNISSCFGPRIEITREYVTNSNWGTANTYEGNADISIEKIIFKDTTIKGFSKDFNFYFVDDDYYTIDSSFCFFLHYTDNWRINRIYFDREQEDITWVKGCTTDLLQETKVIGKLELNTWYKMYRIRLYYVYYVYVDINGKTHIYKFRTHGLFI